MSARYARKTLHIEKTVSDINILFMEIKSPSIMFVHTEPQERISWCPIRKTHTESSSDQALNRKRKASKAEAQLSPKEINVSKES